MAKSATQEVNSVSDKLTSLISEVSGLRDGASEKVANLEADLAEARKELAMIDKLIGFQSGAPDADMYSMNTQRSRLPNGYWKDKIFGLMKDFEDGLTRSEIIEKLEITNDVKATAAVSNTLAVLKKGNEVRHENGMYKPL